jgi:hypothetical protein
VKTRVSRISYAPTGSKRKDKMKKKRPKVIRIIDSRKMKDLRNVERMETKETHTKI